MRRHLGFAAALAAALWVSLGAAGARAQWITVAPPDGGFSVLMPGQAQFQLKTQPRLTTRIWIVSNDALLVVTGVTDYSGGVRNVNGELNADMNNFVKAVSGTVHSHRRLTFAKAPDGPLPALDFTFVSPKGSGESLLVVSGDRAYQVVVRSAPGHDGRAEIARVLKSFRITARKWHAPAAK